MTHVHYCPDCENNWECANPDCEKYAAYLCLDCFETLIYLKCYEASTHGTGSTQSKRKLNGGVEGAKTMKRVSRKPALPTYSSGSVFGPH